MICKICNLEMKQGKMQIPVEDRTVLNVPCLQCPKCGAALIPDEIHEQARDTVKWDAEKVIDYENHYGNQTPDVENMMPPIP